MRKALLSILLAGGGVLALASPAGAAPSPRACNAGTMRAHMTAPYNKHSAAHANIPRCSMG